MRHSFSILVLVAVGATFMACGGGDGSANNNTQNGDGGNAGGGANGTGTGTQGGGGGGTSDGGGGGGGGGTDSGGGGGGGTVLHPASVPPTKTCSYTPDADGFFQLTSPQGTYWVRLPKGYDKTKPTPVVIAMHGCGDQAHNFATWAAAPYNNNTNARQNEGEFYIGISVEDSANGCWSNAHVGKTLAALDDAATCFYVDQARVTVAGYSSGAGAAYYLGMSHAERFNGILIEDGAAYDIGSQEDSFLANAKWKLNIAHMAHDSDADYPLAQVQADWAKLTAAGFPLQTSHVPGMHDGTADDWFGYLLPKITTWVTP